MRPDLVRFQRIVTTPDGKETIHYLWVIGESGAVSTAFFPGTRSILGHSVPTHISAHSPRPLPEFDVHGACEFLEAPCWVWHGSSLGLEPLVAAYDADDYDTIWEWLAGHYDGLLVTLALGAELVDE